MSKRKLFEGKVVRRDGISMLSDKNELLVMSEGVDSPTCKFDHFTKWVLDDCIIYLPNTLGINVINKINKSSDYYGFDIEEDIEQFLPGYLDDNFNFLIFNNPIGSCVLSSDVLYDDGEYVLYYKEKRLVIDADFYRVVEEYYKRFDHRFYISFEGDGLRICADTPHTAEWIDIDIIGESKEINVWNLLPFSKYKGSDELVEELRKYLKRI